MRAGAGTVCAVTGTLARRVWEATASAALRRPRGALARPARARLPQAGHASAVGAVPHSAGPGPLDRDSPRRLPLGGGVTAVWELKDGGGLRGQPVGSLLWLRVIWLHGGGRKGRQGLGSN